LADAGPSNAFAFVPDAFEEERLQGITIDTSHIYFRTKKRPYLIIDTPGHREFIRNMLTGASYAETAVLIIDITEGIREQTRRHAWLLNMVGIKDICVVLNKFDIINYEPVPYLRLCEEVNTLFSDLSLGTPTAIIPVSALAGENVASRSRRMPWYVGPLLVEVMDAFNHLPIENRPFRFPVQDVYTFDDERIFVGRVEAGRIERGMTVHILPDSSTATVSAIKKYPEDDANSAVYGDAVGLVLSGVNFDIRRGDVIAAGKLPQVGIAFAAHLFWFHNTFVSGQPVVLRCGTCKAPASIRLDRVYDPANPDTLEQDPSHIEIGEVARCFITTDFPVVFDNANLVPELGRFVVELDGLPVGAGLVM
jgi:sulfate adenylyltransferase subunit 1 (EFTu-like GTPase family)